MKDRMISEQDKAEIRAWREKITTANRYNIFCHCRFCHYEWVDSALDALCPNCSSRNVQRISCWQFPDD